jgi:hypothetical protein
MPQRTNEFQKLVYLVKKHSATGSTVTESKFLTDSNGHPREVDICIEDSIAGFPVTINIECCDLTRPATVEWVEQMKGKHDDLPTNLLILFSGSGFTEPAKEKAQTYRKHVIALETLDETSAERLFNGANLLLCKTSAQTATKVVIGLAAGDGLPAKEETFLLPADNTIAIFNEFGKEIAGLQILVSQILRSPKAIYRGLQTCEDKHKSFSVRSDSVTEGQGNPIFLRHDGPNHRILRLIESVTISGDMLVKTSPVPLQHGKLEDTTVAWGTVPHEGKQALIVASKDKLGDTKASFDIGERTVQLQKPPEPPLL